MWLINYDDDWERCKLTYPYEFRNILLKYDKRIVILQVERKPS